MLRNCPDAELDGGTNPKAYFRGRSGSSQYVAENTNSVCSSSPVEGLTENTPGSGGPLVVTAMEAEEELDTVVHVNVNTKLAPAGRLPARSTSPLVTTASGFEGTTLVLGGVRDAADKSTGIPLTDHDTTPEPVNTADPDRYRGEFTFTLEDIVLEIDTRGADSCSTTTDTEVDADLPCPSSTRNANTEVVLAEFSSAVTSTVMLLLATSATQCSKAVFCTTAADADAVAEATTEVELIDHPNRNPALPLPLWSGS
jgi:hypothetical protein